MKFCDSAGLTLLEGGRTFFPALIDQIDAARDSVRLETYIYCHDNAGESISAALIRAAARGVDVRVITDGVGTARLPMFESWPAAGVAHRIFNPHWYGAAGIARDHRKLAVVDYRVAYVGGINIVDDMMNDGLPLSSPRWDFAVELLGPVVRDVALAFDLQWDRLDPARQTTRDSDAPSSGVPLKGAAGGDGQEEATRDRSTHDRTGDRATPVPSTRTSSGTTPSARWRFNLRGILRALRTPPWTRSWRERRAILKQDLALRPEPSGTAGLGHAAAAEPQVAFVARDNRLNRRAIERAYLHAIGRAAHRVLLANPYFTPGRRLRRALTRAAARGVDVRLLIGRKEFRLLDWAVPSLYGAFLRRGVRIAEYDKAMLHGKVAVVDDEWATVGSSNLDALSLFLNQEANVVIVHDPAIGALRRSIERAFDDAREIDPARYSARGWVERLVNWLAYSVYRVTMRVLTAGRYD